MTVRNKRHILAIATPMLFAGLTSFATLDTAAAGASNGNRAAVPRTAAAPKQGVSPHIEVVNQNKTLPVAKTEKLCPGHRCHYTPGDH